MAENNVDTVDTIIVIKKGESSRLDTADFKVGELAYVKDKNEIYTKDIHGNKVRPKTDAVAAEKLETERRISLTGDVSGNGVFDGSKDMTIDVEMKNSGVTPGTYPKTTVDEKGIVTKGEELIPDDIPKLDSSKITTGNFAASRIDEDIEHCFVSEADIASWNNKVDKVSGKQLSAENYTAEEKGKLANIQEKANYYVHPSDPNTRHVSDTQVSGWDARPTVDAVKALIQAVIGTAPDSLDTLKEIGDALNNDPNFATTIINALTQKVDKVTGKQLSTEDYTTTEKNKLAGITAGANMLKSVYDTNNSGVVDNAEKLGGQASSYYLSTTGDVSNTVSTFSQATTRANLTTGEKISISFGKIMKWFADLGTLAFKSSVLKSDLDTALQNEISNKESAFSKKTAFNKDFGTAAGTVTEGNDSRLSNARTPTAHKHNASDIDSGTMSPDRILRNANNRLVTDTQITAWDNKISTDITSNGVRKIQAFTGYYNAVSSITGAIKITMPYSWNNIMHQILIKGYNYSAAGTWELVLGGYNYAITPSWVNTSAVSPTRNIPNDMVRFGHDGSKCCIVLGDIGSSWAYPAVELYEVIAGYGNSGLKADGWTISIITSISGITFTGGTYYANKISPSLITQDASNRFMTDSERDKLGKIAANAQVNVIESIKRNGTALTITSKGVDISVPTKISDLTNDAGLITSVPDATASIKGITTLGTSGGAARFGQKADVNLDKADNTSDAVKIVKGLLQTDSRSTNPAPFDAAHPSAGLYADFKYNTADGLSDGGTYHRVLTYRPWSDSSGGVAMQMAFTDNGNVWIRSSTSGTAWGAWVMLPKSTGNIATATKLQTGRKINNVIFDGSVDITVADSTKEPAFTKNSAFNKNFGTTTGTVCQGDDNRLSNARTPTAHNHDASNINSGTMSPARIAQDANNRFATDIQITAWNAKPTVADVNALIQAIIGAAPASLDTLKEIGDALNNDPNFANTILNHITSLQTAVNGKEAAITTLPVSKGGTGAKTLTGIVKGNGTGAMTAAVAGTDYVAPNGSISGNAATATKLQTARTISLTGDVTGSGNFDGSANLSISAAVANDSHNHTELSVKSDNFKDALALPSTYPRGVTVFFSNNPTNAFNGTAYCTVQTIKGYTNMACVQYIYPYNVDAPIYYRYGLYNSDSWKSWRALATNASDMELYTLANYDSWGTLKGYSTEMKEDIDGNMTINLKNSGGTVAATKTITTLTNGNIEITVSVPSKNYTVKKTLDFSATSSYDMKGVIS